MHSPPDSESNAPYVRHGTYCFVKEVVSGKGCIHYIDQGNPSVRVLKRLPPIPTTSLLGLPYGAVLELRGKEWVRVPRARTEDLVQAVMKEVGYEVLEDPYTNDENDDVDQSSRKRRRIEEAGGNSDLVDNNKAQTLRQAEVLALKDSGVGGMELIKTLIENSQSFGIRSQFSQEKYILRKMKSHLVQVTVYQCDSVNIAQAYREPCKIGGLRPSDVYMMMNEANVTAGRDFIVFDHSTGYLTMNVLERLGGVGTCLFLTDRKGVSHHIVDQCNLSDKLRQVFTMIPMGLLEQAIATKYNEDLMSHEWFQDCSQLQAIVADESNSQIDRERAQQAIEKRKGRRLQRLQLWKNLQEASFDGLLAVIDASRVEASSPHLLAKLLSDLYKVAIATIAPGGRFVCYCSQMNPLVDLTSYMKSRKNTWNNIKLEETFVRKICVLPGRSHPQMEGNLRLFEGYLMSASRMVETEWEPTPLPDQISSIEVSTEA